MSNKFFLCSFQRVITAQMNPSMAIEFCKFVRMYPVGKELFAMGEKIQTQLYHMQMHTDLSSILEVEPVALASSELSIYNNEEETNVSRDVDAEGQGESGSVDRGSSQAAA